MKEGHRGENGAGVPRGWRAAAGGGNLEEVGFHFQDVLKFEGLHVQHPPNVHLAVRRLDNLCGGVDALRRWRQTAVGCPNLARQHLTCLCHACWLVSMLVIN